MFAPFPAGNTSPGKSAGKFGFSEGSEIFLLSIQRLSREIDGSKDEINSILKFDYINSSKSKNIDQNNPDLIIELLAINLFKKDKNYEIALLFQNNGFITLSTEIVEVTLEDQNKKKND